MPLTTSMGRAIPRSISAAGLLVAEYLVLFLALARFFDGDAIARLPDIWRMAIHYATSLAGGTVLGLAAAVIIWGDKVRTVLETTEPPAAWDRRWLALHAVSYVLFVWMSFAFLSHATLAARSGPIALVLWIGAGVALTVALLRAAFGSALLDVIRRLGWVFVGAGLTGALIAFALVQVFPYWTLLALPTLNLSAAFLDLFVGDVYIDPERYLLGAGGFVVHVASQCSGIEGMVLSGMLLSGYLIRFRTEHRFPQALLIIPIGIGLSFLANALRIALLIVVGAYVHPEIASGAFHSMAGWIFFCLLSIGLIALSRQVRWFRRAEVAQAGAAVTTDNPTASYLLPFLVWLAFGMLTSALILTLDTFYPLRVILVLGVLYLLRRGYGEIFGTRTASRSTAWEAAAPWLNGVVVFVVWLALAPAPETLRTFDEVAASTGWAPWFFMVWVLFRLIGTVIVVPIVEELGFRGYLQRRLVSADFTSVPFTHWAWLPVLASAVAFGMMHGNWIAGVFSGVAFSYAVKVRGRLSDAIIAHAVANLLLSVCVLGLGRWDLW